jgi:hypothetical protein
MKRLDPHYVSSLLCAAAEVLPPVDIGTPPPDFPFQLAGYTDIAPEEFVYARTPQGNWVASAVDPAGRVFVIDQAGDLYYDSGNPQVGVYAVSAWCVRRWCSASKA